MKIECIQRTLMVKFDFLVWKSHFEEARKPLQGRRKFCSTFRGKNQEHVNSFTFA